MDKKKFKLFLSRCELIQLKTILACTPSSTDGAREIEMTVDSLIETDAIEQDLRKLES